MDLSAEISLYPLSDKYKDIIHSFISDLQNQSNLKVETNGMSTQVFGSYDDVMLQINKHLKPFFSNSEHVVCIIKYMNSDRSK